MDPRWHTTTPTAETLQVASSHQDARRALRRAVALRCDLVSHYGDIPEAHLATDVSPYGLWVDTALPLHPGSEVVLGFSPPRYEGPEMLVFGTVTRVVTGRRRGDRGRLGMAIEFRDLTDGQRAAMATSLQGIAPRVEHIRSVA